MATDEIINEQKNSLGINDFIVKSQEYTKDTFKGQDINDLFGLFVKGQVDKSFIFDSFINIFQKEFKDIISLMIEILIIVIINSILKNISDSLSNSSTSKIVYFIQYVIIASIILKEFSQITSLTVNAIRDIVSFMKILIPLLLALMLATGNFAFSNIVQPILIVLMNFIGEFVIKIAIPLVTLCMVLSIVSNLSDEVTINKLLNFIKKIIIWSLGIGFTIFVTTLSIEGTLGKSVDALTSKTAKAIVTDFIPVFGKIIGDTAETVIGCSKLLKSSVGIIGIIVIIGITFGPVIKLGLFWVMLGLTSSVCEVIAEKKIVLLMEQISDCYKILFGILVSLVIMLIVGITIVINVV